MAVDAPNCPGGTWETLKLCRNGRLEVRCLVCGRYCWLNPAESVAWVTCPHCVGWWTNLSGMPWAGETYEEVLLASAARTANGTAESGEEFGSMDRIRAQLDVTAASGTTPNLTAFVETTMDGTNWDVVGTFAAKTAAGREVITVNPWIGRRLRVRWVITGTTPSFTFSVRIQGEVDA